MQLIYLLMEMFVNMAAQGKTFHAVISFWAERKFKANTEGTLNSQVDTDGWGLCLARLPQATEISRKGKKKHQDLSLQIWFL